MYPHPARFILFFSLSLLQFGLSARTFSMHSSTSALIDTIDPQITCPANVTLNLLPGACNASYDYTILYTDDQPGVSLVQASGIPTGGLFPIGTTVNLYVAIDASGNTATCNFNVVVVPFSGPVICKDMAVVKLLDNCTNQPPVSTFLDPNSFGCPANYGIEVDKTPPFGNGPWLPGFFSAADINKLYQFRITDNTSGNKCWGQVLVVDSMPPSITCINIVTNCAIEATTPAFLKDSLGYTTAFPVVMDNCQLSQAAPVYVDIVQDLPCNPASDGVRRRINRVWSVTDAVGNKSTCTQVISLKADPATVIFPADTVYYACQAQTVPLSATGTPYFKVGTRRYPVLQAQICDIDANYFDTLVPISQCEGARKIKRTWKLYDLCGQQPISNFPTVGVQIIDIVDTTGPTLSCPANVTVSLPTVDCVTAVDLPDFIISDQCSHIASLEATYYIHGLPFTLAGTFEDVPGLPASGYDTLGVMGAIDGVPSGITTVQYLASDACGNTSICAFKLHVWDQVAPTAVCDTLPVVFLTGGLITQVDAGVFDDGSVDICTDLDFRARRVTAGTCQSNTLFYKQLSFCCADIGDTIPIVLRVYDVQLPADSVAATFGSGQFSDCSVNVIIRDTLPAQCAAPKDTVVTCAEFKPNLPYGAASLLSCQVDSIVAVIDYAQFDTVCKKGIIHRNFQTYFGGVKGGTCSQKITVEYFQDYAVRFPDDVIVTMCNGSGDFGTPQIHKMGCEDIKITYKDEIFTVVPDACYKIERVWKVINLCHYDSVQALVIVPNPTPVANVNNPANLPGPTVSRFGTPSPWAPTVIKINPADAQPTDYSAYWTDDSNGFQYRQIIKIIDTQDPVIATCPGQSGVVISDQSNNDPLLWNEVGFTDTLTQSQDLAEGSLDSLSIKATDLCAKDNISFKYLLFLDLNQDGIQETVLNSNLVGGSSLGAGLVPFNNYNNPNYTGGTARGFDQRNVPNNQLYRFALQVSTDGTNKTAKIAWNTAQNPLNFVPAQLPYGRHRVKWFVEDNCGNETVCEYYFTIKDGKAPSITCLQNFSKTLGTNHQAVVNATDLIQNYSDNYTPTNLLKISIREAGSNLPLFPNGFGLENVFFTCADTGLHSIELWVRDLNGLLGTCTTQVNINDNAGNCANPPIGTSIMGNIRTETPAGIHNVDINIQSTGNITYSLPALTSTDTLGNFIADLSPYPVPSNSILKPSKDDNPLNGVSTFDLLLISKHVLGIQPLSSPYKIIAADVNKSGSVTSFDIVEARKLILGIYSAFPNNTSWRFVPTNHVFLNPFNPFQGGFPEFINLSTQSNLDFIGIKVADVNGNAQTDNLSNADARSIQYTVFTTPERVFEAGETVQVHVESTEKLLGYQFSLEFKDLELLDLKPEAPYTREYFGVFPNCVTASIEDGNPSLDLQFKALKSGKLSERLRFSDLITRSEVYTAKEQVQIPVLCFKTNGSAENALQLYQNVPNPFENQTLIGFHLPAAGNTHFSVVNQNGKVVYRENKYYDAGEHSINLPSSALNGPGIYYYQLDTDQGHAVQKLIVL